MTSSEGPIDLDQAEATARLMLELAHTTGEPIDCSQSSVQIWSIALDHLVQTNRIEVVKTNLPRLLRAFPDVIFLQTMMDVFAQLPSEPRVPFADDLSQSVQLVQSPGADAVVFAFTGIARRLFLELNLFHRWIAGLGVHIVYLREPKPTLFLQGISSLASDYSGTVTALERLAADLGVRRIYCLGTCFGGYAALRYGIDLGAERALAYSPRTFVAPDGAMLVGQSSGQDASESRNTADLRRMLLDAAHRPLARLVFGCDSQMDATHANNLADVPNVILDPLPGAFGHNSVCASIRAHRFDAHLAWLVDRRSGATSK